MCNFGPCQALPLRLCYCTCAGKYVGNRPVKLRKSTWKERLDEEALKQKHRVSLLFQRGFFFPCAMHSCLHVCAAGHFFTVLLLSVRHMILVHLPFDPFALETVILPSCNSSCRNGKKTTSMCCTADASRIALVVPTTHIQQGSAESHEVQMTVCIV